MPFSSSEVARQSRLPLFLGALQALGTVVELFGLRLPLWAALPLLLVMLAAAVVWRVLRKHTPEALSPKDLLATALRLQLGALKWLAYAVPGVAVALGAYGAVWLASGDACRAPVDLRVLTAADNVTALNEAAAAYVADRSGDGCRNAVITVAAGSSTEDVLQGFAHGWQRPGSDPDDPGTRPENVALLGPRPDVWIPETTAVATEVAKAVTEQQDKVSGALGHREHAVLEPGESLGTSPMVIAVFARDYHYDSRQGSVRPELRRLLDDLKRQQQAGTLMRPSAETSEAALMTTPALYEGLTGSGQWATSETKAEKLLNSGLAAGDAATLLCRFRAQDRPGASPPDQTAVVVPEAALARYDGGRPMAATGCEGRHAVSRAWHMYPYYAADLPVLDHPFVQVRWPGEASSARDHAVEDFHAWLRSHPLDGLRTVTRELPASGGLAHDLSDGQNPDLVPDRIDPSPPGHPAGCDEGLRGALDCYARGRPQTSLTLLLDVSASMAEPLPTSESRLAREKDIARSIVASARNDDDVSLETFSGAPAPTRTAGGVANPNGLWKESLKQEIEKQVVNGRDLPLATAIGRTVPKMTSPHGNLVVLTDGQSAKTNPGARSLADRLHDEYPALNLYVVLTGPGKCADAGQPAAVLTKVFGSGTCTGDFKVPADGVAATVMSDVLWGSS